MINCWLFQIHSEDPPNTFTLVSSHKLAACLLISSLRHPDYHLLLVRQWIRETKLITGAQNPSHLVCAHSMPASEGLIHRAQDLVNTIISSSVHSLQYALAYCTFTHLVHLCLRQEPERLVVCHYLGPAAIIRCNSKTLKVSQGRTEIEGTCE